MSLWNNQKVYDGGSNHYQCLSTKCVFDCTDCTHYIHACRHNKKLAHTNMLYKSGREGWREGGREGTIGPEGRKWAG